MHVLKGLVIAFASYTRIPMPQVEWSKENMRYSICFFPLVGAVLGGLLLLWRLLCGLFSFGTVLFAAVAACLPVLVTGGFHMDGYCDTVDALASCQPAARKLEILKDSNCGAFAVTRSCVYFLLYAGAFSQLGASGVCVLAVGYLLSRSLSGLTVLYFRPAKSGGLAAAFQEAAQRRAATVVLSLTAAGGAVGMLILSPWLGAAAALSAGCVFLWYRRMAYKQFGGVTGDLAGYFLTQCELWMALAVVLMKGVLSLWS